MSKCYFDWIESVADPEFEQIRERIEALWLGVPPAAQAEYEARLRSKDCTNFFSAYNELWYHHALEAGGLRCFAPETTPGRSLPDWLVGTRHGPSAVAECHVRTLPTEDLRADLVERQWFDETFRKLKDKRIRLWIHAREYGPSSPSAARFAEELDALVASPANQVELESSGNLGRHQYEDEESGWKLEFTLDLRQAAAFDGIAQLRLFQFGGASACRGAELFQETILDKSRQHSSSLLPVVLCESWNYFKHEPDFEEVRVVVAKRAILLEQKRVCGVFWSREVYPWNPAPRPPQLLHWGARGVQLLLESWTGGVVDVRQPSPSP